MGFCESMSYIGEKKLKDYPGPLDKEKLKRIGEQMEKTICKIKSKNGSSGTGFFCEIPFPDNLNLLPVLITNYHVLGDEDVKSGNIINISIDDDKYKYEININNTKKIYLDETTDISIIEIKNKCNLENVSFLEIDNNILDINKIEELKGISIYLLHYPNGDKIETSLGVLKNISEKYDIIHFCETRAGSSGGPILNLTNYKVIGIHKGASETGNYNIGAIISRPIANFYEDFMTFREEKNKVKEFKELQKREYHSEPLNEIKPAQHYIILNQIRNSICKIQKKSNDLYLGFFFKIHNFKENSLLPVLITNNSILNEDDIMDGKEIFFSMNDDKIKKTLKMDNSRIRITDKNLDFTIIEIKLSDEIDISSVLEIDKGYSDNSKNFLNIYLVQFFGSFEYSPGKLIGECENKLIVNSIKEGLCGSPIINLNNFKLLGIYKGRGIGTCITKIIERIKDYYIQRNKN